MKRLARTEYGGMLPIVIACVAVLVAIIVGAFSLSFIFSGEQKVRSVVDSGALMLAEHAPDQKVKPPQGFEDCADTSGKIGLMNINRVIGKAMLINANAESMKNDGQTGRSEGPAAQAMQTADDAAEQVKQKVTDSHESKLVFSSATGKPDSASNASEAADKAGQAAPQTQFDSSFVHRGDESNIAVDPKQMPPNVQLPQDSTVTSQAGTYLKGYQQVTLNGKSFYFVPFRTKELPHLIATEEFTSNKKDKKPLGWGSAIPNAFQVVSTGNVASNMVSVAAAVANPGQRYNIAIPHAFVVIRLHPTPVQWKVNGMIAGATSYNFQGQQQQGVKKFPVQCAKLDGFGNVGNEYKSQDLYSIMAEAVPGDHTKMIQNIDQRIREIDPSFKTCVNLLQSVQVTDPSDTTFFIYPEYKEKDNTDPTIRIASMNNANVPWMNKYAVADGSQKPISTEKLEDGPNTGYVVPQGSWKLQKATVKVDGQVLWTPSTGANQNLGEIEILRICTVDYQGKCP